MKGLLIKDIRLMLTRKTAIFVFVIVSIVMAMSTDMIFVVNYITFLMGIMTISTIAYDEQDNGMAYLMTLPVGPSQYVKNKLLLNVGVSALTWLGATGIYAIADVATGGQKIGFVNNFSMERLLPLISPAIIMLVFTAVSIPLQLKFGSEKYRMILALAGGGCLAAGLLIGKIRVFNNMEAIDKLVEKLIASPALVELVFLLFAAICIVISYGISVRIVDNKEY